MITVITPTIPGREHLLRECIASVKAAGFPHLIGADPDRTGPAAVRNRLLERVDTEWVLFLDDDDLLYPQYSKIVARSLPGADVVYTAWELEGADQPWPKSGPFDPALLRQQNYIPVTACVRVDAVRAVGGFPAAREEDHALWLRMLDAGYRFRYVPVIGWVYRRHAESRTAATLAGGD